MLALAGLLLQNTYSGCFWILATANLSAESGIYCWQSQNSFCSELLYKQELNFRSSHWNSFVKKDVLRNFANFTGKHLCWSFFNTDVFLWNLQVLRTPNLRFANDCFWNLFFHLNCPFLITYTSGSS